ncbi:outer membrane beta-barrel protein [Winogradskyella maritima]|uniref:Outer membrane protein n=1 Tax=Winogradskyella maritima TaxID=1517766 RepID=A0ABV8AK96_9FLAO|nr:outer membrane beta-barrel protein [Winogradskyella maritima]
MKFKVLLIGLLLFAMPITQAQEFGFGIRGGLNTYSIGDINSRGGSISSGQPDELFSPVKDMGFQAGAYFVAQFGKLYVRPELNYVSSKNHYDFPQQQANWTTSKIDLPILVGYDIVGPVSVYAGPGFNFFGDTEIDGVQQTSFTTGTPGPDLEKTTFNVNVGVTFKFKYIGIDLRYEMGQGETAEELEDFVRSSYGVNLADLRPYKPNVLSLSIFVDLFRTDTGNIGNFFTGLFKSDKCYCPYNK